MKNQTMYILIAVAVVLGLWFYMKPKKQLAAKQDAQTNGDNSGSGTGEMPTNGDASTDDPTLDPKAGGRFARESAYQR